MSDKPDAPAAPAPGRRRLLVLALGGVLVLALAGGGAAWYFLARGHAPAEATATPPKGPDQVVKLGTLVVNVAGTNGRRYLRTTLEIGTSAKEAKRLEQFRAPLVDAAIGVLGTKSLDELLTPGDRDLLRQELRQRLNEASEHAPVTHVFLTEFVVQ